MDLYIATTAFHLPVEGKLVTVGTTVSKYGGQVATLVDLSLYDDAALYAWVGSPNSLLYMAYVGYLPDPAPSGHVLGGTVLVPLGANFVTLAGAAFGFVPDTVAVTVFKPDAAGDNLFATVRAGTVTADGFTADLSAPTSGAGYYLAYVVSA